MLSARDSEIVSLKEQLKEEKRKLAEAEKGTKRLASQGETQHTSRKESNE